MVDYQHQHHHCPFSAMDVLPGSLYLTCLKKAKIPEVAHSLLNVFLFSNKSRLFSFVQSSEDVTLILDSTMLNMFPPDVLTIYGEKWKGLRVILGSCGYSESGIISRLSKILSDNNINIHYLASYSTDYILIPEHKLVKALRCLGQNNVDVTWDDAQGNHIDVQNIPMISTENEEGVGKATVAGTRLAMLPDKFSLATLKKEDYPHCAQAILRLVFFPHKESSFFCYIEAEDEISMIMDAESVNEFRGSECNIMIEQDHWRAVKRFGKLSPDEVGVVHSISSPLSESGISLLYLSTYCSSFIMVREDKFLNSLSILRKHGFTVYVDEA